MRLNILPLFLYGMILLLIVIRALLRLFSVIMSNLSVFVAVSHYFSKLFMVPIALMVLRASMLSVPG